MEALSDRLRDKTSARPCPVCASPADAARIVYEQRLDPAGVGSFAFASRKTPELMHWRLVECRTCGMLFASPAPRELLADAYRDADYDSGEEARYAGARTASLCAGCARDCRSTAARWTLAPATAPSSRSCSRSGFTEVAGVEPSQAALDSAASRVRPLLHAGVFSASDFEPGRLRLFSCLQTVEHLPEPLPVFRDAHALLREGGALLVVCHDRTAPLNRLLGRRSPIYDIEHLQLFDPRSLRGLLERAGFHARARRAS